MSSFGDVRARRRRDTFVGRDEPLALFSANLDASPSNRSYVFSVTGQAGTGKSTLLDRFREIVEERGGRVAWLDEHELELLGGLKAIADQLDPSGRSFQSFVRSYDTYLSRRRELEADPDFKHDFGRFLGQAAGSLSVAAGLQVPELAPVAAAVDPRAMGALAGEYLSLVVRRISDRRERDLVLNPIAELSHHFAAGFSDVCRTTFVGLFIDTFEQTKFTFEAWLIEFLKERYGALPLDWVGVIGGQSELDHNQWEPLHDVMTPIHLDAFSPEDTRLFLTRKGISDEAVISEIIEASDCLPVLVATLAASKTDAEGRLQPGETVVSRFLRGVTDPARRRVALLGALPRVINRDIITELAPDVVSESLFDWLRSMPFARSRGDGWTYHGVVRKQMIRLQHRESPDSWYAIHKKMTERYERLINDRHITHGERYRNDEWRKLELERVYHQLCGSVETDEEYVIGEFFHCLFHDAAFGRSWISTVASAASDAENSDLARLATLGGSMMAAMEELQHADVERFLREFAASGHVTGQNHRLLQHLLSQSLLAQGHHEAALAELDRAVLADDSGPEGLMLRASYYESHQRYESALVDLTAALDLEQNDKRKAYILARRSGIQTQMGRHDASLTDSTEALRYDNESVAARYARGRTLGLIGEYGAASEDLRWVTLKGDEIERHNAWRELSANAEAVGDVAEALAARTRAIELDPSCSRCWDDFVELAARNEPWRSQLPRLAYDALDVEDVDALVARAAALLSFGFGDETVDELYRHVNDIESSFGANYAGLALTKAGHLANAEKFYRRALEIESAHLEATYNLAICRVLIGDDPGAPEVESARARLALERRVGSRSTATYGEAGLAAVIGDEQAALRLLDQALALEPAVVAMAKSDPAWSRFRDRDGLTRIIERAREAMEPPGSERAS